MTPLPGRPSWSPAPDADRARPTPGRTATRVVVAGLGVALALAVIAFLNAHAADGGCNELTFDPAYAYTTMSGVEYHLLGVSCTFEDAPSVYRAFWFL